MVKIRICQMKYVLLFFYNKDYHPKASVRHLIVEKSTITHCLDLCSSLTISRVEYW